MGRQPPPRSADKQPDASDQAHLNDLAVVERLVHDFTRKTLDAVGKADFMAYLDFECRRMNSLFLGGPAPTDRYERGLWNTPHLLGEHVLKALRIEGETRLAVRDAFMLYFSRAIELAEDDRRLSEVLVGHNARHS
jgi:hypothetical protein